MEFLRLMFKFANSRFPKQPDEYSLKTIQSAVFALRQCTGVSRDYLAKCLGLTTAKMINLESYGKPISRDLLVRLSKISAEYSLNVLSEYFANQNLLYQNRERLKMRKETTGL